MNLGNLTFPKFDKKKIFIPKVKGEWACWIYVFSIAEHIT